MSPRTWHSAGPSSPRASSRRPGLCASGWCAVSPSGSAPRIDARKCRPPACCPAVIVRKRPYIYSDAEIRDLVRTAGQLPSAAGLKGRTYSTIFGLLAVTGMRVSEVLALDREDVDLDEGILRIRRTKFGKSRLVAVHESTRQVLADYARERDRVVRRPAAAAFFLSEGGDRVTEWCGPIQLRQGLASGRPALRRRQAAATAAAPGFTTCGIALPSAPSSGGIERASMSNGRSRSWPPTSGHVHVNETYWYIEAVPELLELAARRLESPKEVQP